VDLERKILILHALQALAPIMMIIEMFFLGARFMESRALSAAYLNTPFDGTRPEWARAVLRVCAEDEEWVHHLMRESGWPAAAQTPLSLFLLFFFLILQNVNAC
jgi:hypothetical protein